MTKRPLKQQLSNFLFLQSMTKRPISDDGMLNVMEGNCARLGTYMKAVSCPKDTTAKVLLLYCLWRGRKCLNTLTNLNRQKEGKLFPLESIMHCKSKKLSGKCSRHEITDKRQTKKNLANCYRKQKSTFKLCCVRSLFPGSTIFLQKEKRKRHVDLVSVCLSSSNVCPKDNQESLVYAVIHL